MVLLSRGQHDPICLRIYMRETAWADKLKPQLGNCVVNNFAPTRFPQDPQLIYFIKENDDWYQHLKSTSSHCWCLFEAKKIDSLQHLGKWMLNSLWDVCSRIFKTFLLNFPVLFHFFFCLNTAKKIVCISNMSWRHRPRLWLSIWQSFVYRKSHFFKLKAT